LQQPCLPDGELNGIRRGRNQGPHGLDEIFDPGQKPKLVEKAMVDGNVETAAGLRIEEAVKTIAFHRTLLWKWG
jgi:hypothetical protein